MNRFLRGPSAALPLLLLAGCVTLPTDPSGPAAPSGTPSQIVATWRPDVFYTADPAHGGVERPTLFGRVYLFGPELGYPMAGDGKLVVDLYEGAVPHGATPTPLEEWRFDPVTLRGLLKRDMIGWGYTVPLPWSTYRADVTTVQLKARYEPAKGAPLFAEGAPMAVQHPDQTTAGPVVSESAKPRGREDEAKIRDDPVSAPARPTLP